MVLLLTSGPTQLWLTWQGSLSFGQPFWYVSLPCRRPLNSEIQSHLFSLVWGVCAQQGGRVFCQVLGGGRADYNAKLDHLLKSICIRCEEKLQFGACKYQGYYNDGMLFYPCKRNAICKEKTINQDMAKCGFHERIEINRDSFGLSTCFPLSSQNN